MKRLIFYVGIFLVLAGLSAWSGVAVARVHREALDGVAEAVTLAEEGAWGEAHRKLSETGNAWHSHRAFLESVICREDILFVERSFAAAAEALESQEDEFFPEAAELRVLLENLVVADLPTLGSLF